MTLKAIQANVYDVFDALGDNIITGNSYGYSLSKSGFAHTVLGQAIKVTKTGRVTLKVYDFKSFIYGKPTNSQTDRVGPTVTINPYMLFPVSTVVITK